MPRKRSKRVRQTQALRNQLAAESRKHQQELATEKKRVEEAELNLRFQADDAWAERTVSDFAHGMKNVNFAVMLLAAAIVGGIALGAMAAAILIPIALILGVALVLPSYRRIANNEVMVQLPNGQTHVVGPGTILSTDARIARMARG